MDPTIPVRTCARARSAGCSGEAFAVGVPGVGTGVWRSPARQPQFFAVSQQQRPAFAGAQESRGGQGVSSATHPRTTRPKAARTTGT